MSKPDQDLATKRRSYEADHLEPERMEPDPIEQFRAWLDEAGAESSIKEANAMSVATVDASGQPSSRIVLLRGYDARGFVFFTNYESRKGRELAATPKAALLFFWEALEREIRIEGRVERIAPDESDVYFAKRPVGHRLSAWASPQSSVVADRTVLEEASAAMRNRFADDVPRPPFWGGYRVVPQAIEFWQGRRDRLHDRLSYRREADDWCVVRLAP